MRGITPTLVPICVLAAGLTLAAAPQTQQKPLSKEQVMGLVRNQMGDETGAKVIEMRGINFAPTPDFIRSLKTAGANEAFIRALLAARGAVGPAQGAQAPLDIFQIFDLLINEVPEERLALLVSQRGITFKPDDNDVNVFREVGAGDAFLYALRSARVVSGDDKAEVKHAAVVEVDYRARLQQDPHNRLIRYALAKALEMQGKTDDEVALFREAVKMDPDDQWGHARLADILDAKKDYDGSIAEYREVLRLKPDDIRTHYMLAGVLGEKKDIDGQIAEYREVVHLKPLDPRAHDFLAGALAQKEDYKDAIPEYREALRLKPDPETEKIFLLGFSETSTRMNLAKALEKTGDWDGLIAEYRDEIARDPKNALAHGGLAYVLWRQKNDADGAITEFRESLRLNPEDYWNHWNLGSLYDAKGDLDNAIAEYRQTLRLMPDFWIVHKELGDALYKKHDLDGAAAQYHELIRLSPDSGDSHLDLGSVLYAKEEFEEAAAEFREAVRLNPKSAAAHYDLGLTLSLKQQSQQALEEYHQATELEPNNADYRTAYENLKKQLGP